MWIYIILVCVVYFLYVCVYRTWARLNWYVKTFESLGYKVYSQKYGILGTERINKWLQNEKKCHDPYHQEKNQFVNYDIVVYNIFTKILISPINIDIVRELFTPDKIYLQHKSNFAAGSLIEVLGNGLPFSEDQLWKKKRKILTQVFNFEFLKANIPMIIQAINQQFDKMEKRQTYPEIFIKDESTELFSSLTASMFFGDQINKERFNGESLSKVIQAVTQDAGLLTKLPETAIFGPKVIYLRYRPLFRKLCNGISIYKQASKRFVTQKLQKIEQLQKNGEQYSTIHKDVVSEIHRYNKLEVDLSKRYTLDEIASEFGTLYFAGTDTSSYLVMMMLYYIDLNPSIKQKLQREVQRVVKSDDDLNFDNLKNLHYLECIQKETIRYYNIIPGLILREATKDHKIGDMPILKGDWLSYSIVTIHYSPQYYTNPHQFCPERWEGDTLQKTLPPHAFGGFGGGPRSCIGKTLSLLQTKIFIVQFLRRYHYKMTKKQIRLKWGLFTSPQKIYLRLEKRI